MTKAIRFHETGGPEVLQYEDVDIGTPGEGEVLIDVEAIGLNRAEVMFRSGAYLEDPVLPAGLGYEGAGVVEAVGAGVSGISEGDAVCVMPAFSMNDYSFCAEKAIVPAYAVTPRPEGLSATEASAVWMPYLTAYGALVDIGGLSEDEAIIIPAASSSVGLAAIQIANRVGAISIAATRTQSKADALREAGAAHVVVTEQQDLAEQVGRITDGHGARMVFDPVAGPMLDTLARASAQNGLIIEYGALANDATPFPLMPSLQKGLSIRGYTLFEVIGDPNRLERAQRFIYAGIAAGELTPTVDRVFGFDEIVEAHRYMESNQQFGKIVVSRS